MPTHRNSSDFATVWNRIRKMAAHTASGAPTPKQALMRPRLEMVEYASTRLALLCEMAMRAASKNVMAPTLVTINPVTG